MGRFDMIQVGDKAELSHIITSDDIEKFVELTGDDNKLHVDAEYARSTSFKKPVVHGMLGASFISTIIGTKLPGDGALWFAQNLEFLLPVRIGDEITVRAEVIKKIERQNLLELQTDIFNQHKQKVTTGVAKVKMIEEETNVEPAEKNYKKVALIVGGTGGIGKATCLQLSKDGFDVAVHYHKNKDAATKIKQEILQMGKKSIIVNADIIDNVQVQEMTDQVVRQLETITLLVNCTTTKIANIKLGAVVWEDIQQHLDVNLKGTLNLLQHIVPVMEKEHYGNIITITTQYIESAPPPELLPYVTAKSALYGFSKAAAVELSLKGIRVNIISPGMTDTELIADIPEKARLITVAKTLLRRIAQPEDIANAVSFLASDKADFLTGETIRVNGGQVML